MGQVISPMPKALTVPELLHIKTILSLSVDMAQMTER